MKSPEDINQLQKLQSKLKVWAIIQIIIAIVAAIFTIIIITQINPLIQQKHQLQKDKFQLEQEMNKLQQSKDVLNNDINKLLIQKQSIEIELNNKQLALNQAVNLLNKQQSEILSDKKKYSDIDLKQSITPNTSAELLSGGPKETKTYLFKLWIEASEDVKKKIRKVDYFFNHPSFGKEKTYSSKNTNDNFSIKYEGWGCLSLVVITIFPLEGKKFDIYFDMCAKLGPEWK